MVKPNCTHKHTYLISYTQLLGSVGIRYSSLDHSKHPSTLTAYNPVMGTLFLKSEAVMSLLHHVAPLTQTAW